MEDVRSKSIALGSLFRQLIALECAQWEFLLASPEDPEQRGSQICFSHPQGYAIMQVCCSGLQTIVGRCQGAPLWCPDWAV